MAAHAKAKQRVHTHKGVDFIVVPGSRREQVLLDLFQSEDRLASPPRIEDDDREYTPGILVAAVGVGFCAGAAFAFLAGWIV